MLKQAASWLQQELKHLYEFEPQPIGNADTVKTNPILDEEHYHLTVNTKGILLEASGHPFGSMGFVDASATLLQLIKRTQDGLLFLLRQNQHAPRFKYRGMMLDCARHFHPVERVKRPDQSVSSLQVQHLFHWHLTDDEGWRIEIKSPASAD